MKWLVILVLLSFLVMMIANRYRRQIQNVLYVWKVFKKLNKTDENGEKQIEQSNNAKEIPFIRCAKCGTWVPQKNALNLRQKTYYCSVNCMEIAVSEPSA